MAIDRKKAVADLSQLKFGGNEQGLIPGFGVLVQQLPAKFWNLFSVKILQAAGDSLYDEAAGLLENAAAECGYHTGWGIITSEEFKAIVGPMIQKKPDDILHGAFAVLTAWGWANSEIIELVSDDKMVVRAYGYYEADIRDIFKPKKASALMLIGVCRAFMDIAYGKPYPNGFGKFKCKQTKAIELGDPYGEFVVTKA